MAGKLYLPAVADFSIKGRQAMGDTKGQSVPGIVGEVESILH